MARRVKARSAALNIFCDARATPVERASFAATKPAHQAQQSERAPQQHSACPAVKQVCRTLGSAQRETQHYTYGCLAFGGLLFAAGAAAWALPLIFIVFAVICLPWRAVSFCKQKWVFYLLDYCYFVNVATVIYLLWYPDDARFESLVYAMADGPLAGALVAWQCPWVFGSIEHEVSVLMHLLPGLALFAHRYHTPSGIRGWQGISQYLEQLLHGRILPSGQVPQLAPPAHQLLWLVGAPLLFYMTWQFLYFLVVQVLFRPFIKANGYETSYICLARRAAKTNNFWNRLVRRGSIARRILMYGLLQLLFTMICITVFLPTCHSYAVGFVYQVVKVVFPVYYGSRYQMTKVPQHVFLKGIEVYKAVQQDVQSTEVTPAPLSMFDNQGQAAAQQAVAADWQAMQLRSCAAEVASSCQAVPAFRAQVVA